MSSTTDLPAYRLRVRYVECDAEGELFPAALVSHMVEAAADAMARAGLDLHELSSPRGPWFAGAVKVDILRPVGYDCELEVLVIGLSQSDGHVGMHLEVRRRRSGVKVGDGLLSYRLRPGGRLPAAAAAALPRVVAGAV